MTTVLLGTAAANREIAHFLTNANIANVGDATGLRGSSAAGVFYVALYTALPTGDDATDNEYTDANYARASIDRASGAGGFTLNTTPDGNDQVSGDNTDELLLVNEVDSVVDPITHAALVSTSSGAGHIDAVYEFPSPVVPVVGEVIVIAAHALVARRITVNDP